MADGSDKPRLRGPAYRAGHLNEPWTDAEFVDAAPRDVAMGGGIEGASRMTREMALWQPSMGSPDQMINRAKPLADMRGRDMTQNDGYANGAVAIHKDSIVGAQYVLSVEPNVAVLNSGSNAGRSAPKFDDVWEEEMAEVVEARFNMLAESEDCWLDASGANTFTGQVRLAVGGFVWTGEVLASAEWIRQSQRPMRTAIRMIAPTRLSNPNGMPDSAILRRGITRDTYGRSQAFSFRDGYPTDPYNNTYSWTTVNARKPWGRRQVIHILEQREADQSRGIADMVSAMKHMRMTKNFSEITLQNAVVQASYAAAIESELPPEAIRAMMGGESGQANFMGSINAYMTALAAYVGASNGIAIDGVKVPHLFPGTKFSSKPLGTPGGIGQDFETSLLRHIAAALGISYEEFSRDFKGISYSAARASLNVTSRFMRARKRMVADRFASQVYQLVFEEEMNNGNVPLPRGVSREYFYVPLMKDAFTSCSWTGSGIGQIDELKETQAALLRIKGGLSTWRKESARLGEDYRKTFKQLGKEYKALETLGVPVDMTAEKTTSGASTQGTLKDNQDQQDDPQDGSQEND